ncbi:MAG: phenylacetate--CoA ligase [Elusimicrobia bacterium RIFOXYB2_FULL_49_7]|nr:MAG: phenylacetate--CoA ligase [Elusimicrobia bacterium RIFOXYB2_FULL_49_7]
MDIRFWDKKIETLPRDALHPFQLNRLQQTIDRALLTPFYQAALTDIGVRSGRDITSLSQLRKLPFTTKEDLRKGFPDAFLAVDKRKVIRVHVSSGTTGMPTVIYHTKRDIVGWTELCARSIVATGASSEDVFQNMMSYGLFTGGLGLHYGGEKVGMMVIPVGSGNGKRQVQLMRDFHTTTVHATPSYLLHLYNEFEAETIPLSSLTLKRAFVGAEPHSEKLRKKIETLYHIDVFNSYGMSEMNGPGVAFECQYKQEMHLWEDAFLMEVIDPQTLCPLPDGKEGELVLTTLNREATPLIRYRSRDLTRILSEPCGCGRTHRRIARIKGRSDDMIIINGVNVFPSQIETILMRFPEVGTNYVIHLDKKEALDRLTIKTEVAPRLFTDDSRKLEDLKSRLRHEFKSTILVNPVIELHEPGSLPVSQGKAIRVVDERKDLN